MMKKILPIFIISVIIIGGGSFYGGMKYAESENSGRQTQKFQAMGAGGGLKNSKPGGAGKGGGVVSGEIIAKDDKSITMKTGNSGSKIIFYSDSTKIEKSIQGTLADLEIGKTIMANGQTNQDGSVIAQSIQIRLETPKQ